MFLLQTPWTAGSLEAADAALAQASRTQVKSGPALALLPHADGSEHEARREDEVVGALATLAKAHGLYLGASAYVTNHHEDATRTVGFIVGPDGTVLARTPKVMPDIIEGYTDTAADTFQPASFQIARTPLGQVGVLCGEDILAPHVVRSMLVQGAEIIFNPSRERSDPLFDSRRVARSARAYENLAYIASASPAAVTLSGNTVVLPPATALYPPQGKALSARGAESYLRTDIDIEALRRKRMGPQLNFPSIVRMNLYAPGYQKEASASAPSPQSREDWIAEGQRRAVAQARPPRSDDIMVYGAMLGQHVVHQSNTPDQLIERRQTNLDDAFDLVRNYGARAANLKLVVFPEFFLTGPVSPLGHKLGHISDKIGVTFPGPEMDQIAAFAQEICAYVSGGVFEYDAEWPNRFFNTAFIYDPSGNLIHRYRKIHCGDAMGFLPDTTPGSVFDQYVDKYGYEHLFPMVDTPIGRLATTICFDNNFPETYRALARRGAEVILHPTSEPHGAHRMGWDSARRMRAFENVAYVLSCGHGGEYFLPGRTIPSARGRGYSKIINFDGSVQAEADTAGQVPLSGVIDLGALRQARADVQANPALWDDAVVYAQEYAKTPRGLPNNLWPDDPLGNPYLGGVEIKKVISGYVDNGIFVSPRANAAAVGNASE
jgi:predicted amidohydrolase